MNQSHIQAPGHEQQRSPLALKIPPVPFGVAVAALMWLISSAVPALNLIVPARTVFMTSLALLGALIAVSGIVSFRLAKTTVNPLKPEKASSLIISGPYKFTRNPMYVGIVFALLGWAVFLSNFAALAGIPLFVVYMNRFQIEPEERALDKLFPQEFPAYRTKVRRWL